MVIVVKNGDKHEKEYLLLAVKTARECHEKLQPNLNLKIYLKKCTTKGHLQLK